MTSNKAIIKIGKLSAISGRQFQLRHWQYWPPDLNFGSQLRNLIAQVTILVDKIETCKEKYVFIPP